MVQWFPLLSSICLIFAIMASENNKYIVITLTKDVRHFLGCLSALVAAHRIFGSSCWIFCCRVQTLVTVCGFSSCVWCVVCGVWRVACGLWLSCSMACRILVPRTRLSPHPLHLKADSSPLDHQGSPDVRFLYRKVYTIEIKLKRLTSIKI